MNDSILTTIKKLLGIDEDYEYFDPDILIDINSAIMTLDQIGIGPKGFVCVDKSNTWNELLGDKKYLEAAKTFIYLSTKLRFDPPQHSFHITSLEKQRDEQIWRLNVWAEQEE